MVDVMDDGGSGSREPKSAVQQRGNVVDYWTKAMVQNMKEETILGRKMAKIEREHTQVILQMTYDHRRLTERLNLVNWYHKKKSEDRDSREEDFQSSNGSYNSEDSTRNFNLKAELREYREWKERREEKKGRISVKAMMEPELRERMKMEWNSLRRPPQPVLPPLVKPSFMYRQWKKKNKKKMKLSPKAMFERRKMMALAEDADKNSRMKSDRQTSKRMSLSTLGKTTERRGSNTSSNALREKDKLSPIQRKQNSNPVLGALNETSEDHSARNIAASSTVRKDSETTFSGHKTAKVLVQSKNELTGVVRPLSSVEAVETTTIIPKSLKMNRQLSRSTTTIN